VGVVAVVLVWQFNGCETVYRLEVLLVCRLTRVELKPRMSNWSCPKPASPGPRLSVH